MKNPILLALLLIMTSLAAAGGERPRCPVCGMFIDPYADWQGTIRFSDGTRAVMDGPKDTLKYWLDVKKYAAGKTASDVAQVTVKDYVSKAEIDARKAWYVIWNDIYGPMGHEPIPFDKEGDAKKFLKEHNGRKIIRFTDITQELLWSLDNP